MNQTTNSTVDQKMTTVMDADLEYPSFNQRLQQEYVQAKDKGFKGADNKEEYLTYRDYT